MLGDAHGLGAVVAALAELAHRSNVTKVAGIEARGFLLAAPVAVAAGVGVVPIRKAGKLPGETHRIDYALEYGTATLEIQEDSVRPGDRVLLIDDVLATGGTAPCCAGPAQRAPGPLSADWRSCWNSRRWVAGGNWDRCPSAHCSLFEQATPTLSATSHGYPGERPRPAGG